MRQLIIVLKAEEADFIADALMEQGAVSVVLETTEEESLFQLNPGEMPLWKKTRLRAFFSADTDPELVAKTVAAQFSTPFSYDIKPVPECDWVRETQKHFPPQCIGETLWIVPSWSKPPSAEKTVVIDPGLAFGTGTHPTTELCLEWLAENPPVDIDVIDFGCGSGILSLACLALGARRVIAIDHDEQALQATKNNATLNAFVNEDNLKIVSNAAVPEVKAPLIIANILANPLIELAPQIKSLAEQGATLVLSGLLVSDIARVAVAYAPEFIIDDTTEAAGWMRLVMHQTDSLGL